MIAVVYNRWEKFCKAQEFARRSAWQGHGSALPHLRLFHKRAYFGGVGPVDGGRNESKGTIAFVSESLSSGGSHVVSFALPEDAIALTNSEYSASVFFRIDALNFRGLGRARAPKASLASVGRATAAPGFQALASGPSALTPRRRRGLPLCGQYMLEMGSRAILAAMFTFRATWSSMAKSRRERCPGWELP